MSMSENGSLELVTLSRRANSLLEEAHRTLADAPLEDVAALTEEFPESVDQEGVPKVVVAGQYSAGKSTLLKALTGIDDIAVGEAITTDEPHAYQWEGIELVDTPGIETSLRPDHDEKSYDEIASADLILYVISNELMDDHIAENFRKLAVEQEKARKMMLVVNKMDRHAQGNVAEAHEVILNELDEVLHPYSTEDIPVAFVAAELALSARDEEDEEFAEFDWEDSGFEAFQEQLDEFVEERGLAGQYTSALHQLQHALLKARADVTREDTAADGIEEMLIQKRGRLMEGRQRIDRQAGTLVRRAASDVRKEGTKAASQFTMGADAEDAENALQTAQRSVEAQAEELSTELRRRMQDAVEELEEDLADLAESEFSRAVIARALREVEGRIDLESLDPDTLDSVAKGGGYVEQMGAWLAKNSVNKPGGMKGLFKLSEHSGSKIHKGVKSVGKFFGKKFKPWEAVKWTKRIGTAGKVLSVAGPVVSIGAQALADMQARKKEKELRELRSSVRSGFNDAADEIEMYFDEQTQTFVAETVESEIEAVDRQLEELRGEREAENELVETVEELLERTRGLIREIQTAETAKTT